LHLEKYNPAFTRSNIASASRNRGTALDLLPFGVIVVDRDGTVVEYNEYERQLAGGHHDLTGKNFFSEVAPWAAVREFEGRWDEFIASNDTTIVPFEFTVPGAGGEQTVTVMFVRLEFDDQHATICIARKPE
jgi:photoactive yellow protein